MLGERLQSILDDKDISQTTLAKELEITQQAVNRWCHNITEPDNKTIVDIANFLGVTTDYLLGNDMKDNLKMQDKENQEILQNVANRLTDPTMKALYSKASELKNDRDKKMVLNVINGFMDDVDNNM